MPNEDSEPRTFVEMVLALLENRFPWLSSDREDVSGADTIDELSQLHEQLIQKRDQAHQALSIPIKPEASPSRCCFPPDEIHD